MYRLNEEKMFCDIADGYAIVINQETGVYYGMNPFGTSVFENLINGSSENDILAALKAFPGTPADMRGRLENFVSALLKKEIVTAVPGEGKKAVLDSAIAVKDNFMPDVSEYADAKDLLLADPVHDVKEETGWQPVLKEEI
jgi:hypothetical protein